jgi:hypothetical protein
MEILTIIYAILSVGVIAFGISMAIDDIRRY